MPILAPSRAPRSSRRKTMRRQAGVVLPLFAIRTGKDWGIGQLTDLPAAAAWVHRAGQRLLQVLPPHTLSPGETSPYGALTAFGLDPIYGDVEAVEDLDAAALDEVLRGDGRSELARLRACERVDYVGVRALKMRAFEHAFERFHAREWSSLRRARSDSPNSCETSANGWTT